MIVNMLNTLINKIWFWGDELKVDLDFYTMLVGVYMENSINNYEIDQLKEKLHILVNKAADTAKSAKEAGL